MYQSKIVEPENYVFMIIGGVTSYIYTFRLNLESSDSENGRLLNL
ncbi:hypothetical protein SRABI80_04300 [Peribacillus frigoritolerans]|nr:hypothetical protein [Peribacillus frigoritolerans]MED3712289.1 hypothetical protein [Peribacillus frigoritolerans]MED3890404.1 hypothetical protein [Peribacillus frigoritolerans]CAH0302989.1 hypothetical protein SRABI80_04300 [Peribacillus frigoritolerans]